MPITDYNDALVAAENAKAWATALRKNTAQPQGQMVGKWYVAPHWSSQLLPAVQDVMGGYAEGASRRHTKEAERGMEQAAQEWISQRPQETMQPTGPELPGPQPEGVEGPIRENEMVPPTQQSQLEWARRGENNPLTKALAAKYGEDVLIKEPERVEARAFRKSEAEANRALKREEGVAKREQELTIARERIDMMTGYYQGILDNGASSIEAKKEASAALNALKEQGLALQRESLAIQRQGLALRKELGYLYDTTRNRAIDNKNSKLDRKAKAEAEEADTMLNQIDVGLSKLSEVKDSPVGSYILGAVTEKLPGGERISRGLRDKTDNEARQMTFNITSGIQHGLYGTALSKYEKGFAQQFLPGAYDDSKVLHQKLTGIKELMEVNRKRLALMETSDLTLEQAQAALPYKLPTAPGTKPEATPAKVPTTGTTPSAKLPSGVTVRKVSP